ncbi:ABC transporter substrate-binding protein [Candidatus Pelagibacter sp.]|nr:ABC transporter substrate-binding protein [Candidatus Pelagibacter sp.]
MSETSNFKSLEFVKEFIANSNEIFDKDIDDSQKKKQASDLIETYFDVKGIGLYSLGKYRKSFKKNEIKEYNLLFKKYFVINLNKRIHKFSKNRSVESEKVLNKNYTLVTSFRNNEPKVEWRVYTKNSKKLKIRDLIFNNLSLARTHKAETEKFLKENSSNPEKLFVWLKKMIQ